MSCFIYSWKLLSENSQAPYEQIHSTFLLTAPLPLKIQEVQVPPFLPILKIFSVPPTRPPQTERGKDTMTDLLPCNPGSAVRIVLQFCTMNVAKRDMGIILMVFLKEILFTAIWSFWNKKWYGVFLTLNLLSGFF